MISLCMLNNRTLNLERKQGGAKPSTLANRAKKFYEDVRILISAKDGEGCTNSHLIILPKDAEICQHSRVVIFPKKRRRMFTFL